MSRLEGGRWHVVVVVMVDRGGIEGSQQFVVHWLAKPKEVVRI